MKVHFTLLRSEGWTFNHIKEFFWFRISIEISTLIFRVNLFILRIGGKIWPRCEVLLVLLGDANSFIQKHVI